jgi:putative chitinase
MNFKVKYKTLLNAYGINTKLRYDHFMSQIEHESKLKLVRESLYYKTIAHARKTFWTPFKGKSDAFVKQYLFNTEKMANYVYSNRMGNGNEASGDGFKFRAGGYIGITGRNNYLRLSKDVRIDFMEDPDEILTEANSLISSLWFWKLNNLNAFADLNDLDAVSDAVNIGRQTEKEGDSNGFADRKLTYERYEAMD